MNRAFYETRPWEYFRHRLRSLMVNVGAPQGVEALVRKEVRIGRLTMKHDSAADRDPEREAKDRENYLIAESEALLHHASETLLRFYVAHEHLPACPWIEIGRIRTPKQFKDLVRRRFLGDMPNDERQDLVAAVFYGAPEPTNFPDWRKGASNIDDFLTYFARYFLDSDPYNALKLGLAVRPGQAAMQLDDGELIKADGPSIEFLSIRRNAAGDLRWNQVIKWLNPDLSLSLTHIAVHLIESLWDLARLRYTGQQPQGRRDWTAPLLADVLKHAEGQKPAITMEGAAMELLYYAKD